MDKFNLENNKNLNNKEDMNNEIGKKAIEKISGNIFTIKEFLIKKDNEQERFIEMQKMEILKNNLENDIAIIQNKELEIFKKDIINSIENTLFYFNYYKKNNNNYNVIDEQNINKNEHDVILNDTLQKFKDSRDDVYFYIKKLEVNYPDYTKQLYSKIDIDNSLN